MLKSIYQILCCIRPDEDLETVVIHDEIIVREPYEEFLVRESELARESEPNSFVMVQNDF